MGEEGTKTEVLAMFFIFFGMTLAVIVKKIRYYYAWVPFTPTIFFISCILGYFSPNLGLLG